MATATAERNGSIKKPEGDARAKVLDGVLKDIEKRFGKAAVMRMGDQPVAQIGAISTGSLSIDSIMGVGGMPRGRVIEVFGPESSGKTTLALHVVANAQSAGGTAAFIDAEHALDPTYAGAIGVDLENLLLSQPDSGEQALEICEALVRSSAVDVIVVDSVAALVPRAEIEGEMGDAHVGLQARLMSQALRKLTSIIARTDTVVIFINQIRMKIGVMFGNPETTPGGRALKFYSSMRVDIRRIGAIKDGDKVVGNRTRIRIVKNKVAPPFKQAEFDVIYGKGISFLHDLLDLAVEHEVVKKAGAWYSYEGEKLGQGKENSVATLKDGFAGTEEITKRVKSILKDDIDPGPGCLAEKAEAKPAKANEPVELVEADEKAKAPKNKKS